VTVLVTGGTGFVGSRVVHALRAHGNDVRVLVRQPERARHLTTIGVELARGDVTDPANVQAAIAGCTQVVHLVAILTGAAADFEQVMTQGTRSLVAAAQEEGVERFVLMSALGTDERTKDLVPYYAAKWAMEREVEASGLAYTTFRPSFVFGKGGALATFVKQVRYSPVVTVIGNGKQRIQPIWIDDVAEYFAQALEEPAAANRTFELGGPDVVTWNELYRLIAKTLGKRRRLLHVPFSVARAGARLTQWVPGAPLTTDQIAMIQAGDNALRNSDAVEMFRIPLVALEEQLRRAV
jgi:NADH dehydrogenase